MYIKEISTPKQRSCITELILRQLPDYFGIEESTLDYIQSSEQQVMIAAFKEDQPIGFLTLKHHNEACIEVYAMGVLPAQHHEGIGRALMEHAFEYAKSNRYIFMSVKTLGPTHPDEGYRKTRGFYYAMGFQPLEESFDFWGMDCPCLFMVKYLGAK